MVGSVSQHFPPQGEKMENIIDPRTVTIAALRLLADTLAKQTPLSLRIARLLCADGAYDAPSSEQVEMIADHLPDLNTNPAIVVDIQGGCLVGAYADLKCNLIIRDFDNDDEETGEMGQPKPCSVIALDNIPPEEWSDIEDVINESSTRTETLHRLTGAQ
jgi:hypothetical protein